MITPGNGMLTISLTCPTTSQPVQLQTREWRVEIDGENKVIHYNALCNCGAPHFGFMTEKFAIRHASVR